jgi:hypothetical protein
VLCFGSGATPFQQKVALLLEHPRTGAFFFGLVFHHGPSFLVHHLRHPLRHLVLMVLALLQGLALEFFGGPVDFVAALLPGCEVRLPLHVPTVFLFLLLFDRRLGTLYFGGLCLGRLFSFQRNHFLDPRGDNLLFLLQDCFVVGCFSTLFRVSGLCFHQQCQSGGGGPRSCGLFFRASLPLLGHSFQPLLISQGSVQGFLPDYFLFFVLPMMGIGF